MAFIVDPKKIRPNPGEYGVSMSGKNILDMKARSRIVSPKGIALMSLAGVVGLVALGAGIYGVQQ